MEMLPASKFESCARNRVGRRSLISRSLMKASGSAALRSPVMMVASTSTSRSPPPPATIMSVLPSSAALPFSGKLKGNAALLGSTDMIVAGGGGERDVEVDATIMTGLRKAADPDAFINERLMSDLRPTLFLAQLSNLLAGNISIVHGVTGSSRTFMGEELAGIDAVQIALARVAAGQSDISLVGGAHNGERKDLLVLYEFGDFNLKDKFAPVWARHSSAGFALGSAGAFLVIESRAHAEARGAKPYARLSNVVADLAHRKHAGEITATLEK